MLRLLIGVAGGVSIAFGLFMFMASLIQFTEAKIDQTKTPPIEFSMIKPDEETKSKERRVPRKPEPPKAPPPPSAERVQNNERPQAAQLLDLKISNVALGSGGDGIAIGGMGGGVAAVSSAGGGVGMDSEAIPVATLPPRYPREAAANGVEGYVCFQFTVGPEGAVSELEITKSKPPRVFDQEARRALAKWKFKPSFVDGKPVAATGKKYCLDFKLDDAE